MTKTTLVEISILLIPVPALQILLDERQQKWVQDKLETLTLKLDDLRPAAAYQKMKLFTVQIALGILTFFLANLIEIVRSMNETVGFTEAFSSIKEQIDWKDGLTDVVRIAAIALILRWLTRGNIVSFVRKVGIVTVSIVTLLVVVYSNNWLDFEHHRTLILLFMYPLAVAIGTCLFGLFYVLLIYTAQALVRLLSNILYRIVAHPKGALTVIATLDTVLLAILGALNSLKK
jgi:hypothetical protein